MNSRKLIHSLLFFIFVLLSTSCREKQVIKAIHSTNISTPQQKNNTRVMVKSLLESTKKLKIEDIEIKEENHLAKLSIDISYPQIKDSVSNRSDKFNNAIRRFIVGKWVNVIRDSAISDYKTALRSNRFLLGYSLDGGCGAIFEYGDKLSVRCDVFAYTGGGHGLIVAKSFNYDLDRRAMLKLDDLFKNKSDYLKRISDYCRATLKKKEELIDKELIEKGTNPLISNFRIWNISAEGIEIYFEDYHVAPHSNSPQEVLVPYSILLDIIKPDGPLAPLLIK